MTNHSETTGTSETSGIAGEGDISARAQQEDARCGEYPHAPVRAGEQETGEEPTREQPTGVRAGGEESLAAQRLGLGKAGDPGFGERGGGVGGEESAGRVSPAEPLTFVGHGTAPGLSGQQQVTLRTPAELADALPYLLGYRPEDSIVLVALHDREQRGRFGGRARLGIPAQTDDWSSAAGQLARGLVLGSERRGARPETMVAYLCQEPRSGESGRDVMERLRPLAQLLRTACGTFDVPVVEALCISDGRFWSYCCPSEDCCPPHGEPMGLPGTSVLAAAATYAGLQVRGSLREFRARLSPWETAVALDQEAALDAASMSLVPRILDAGSRTEVAEETLDLARKAMGRIAGTRPVAGSLDSDRRDDELLGHDEAAALILGLQDRTTRDRAAEWMEGEEAGPALRLWRALARRCVGPYAEHAAAPLTLAGWVAWSSGDELEAREALAMAIGVDPDYLFARLLHQACNEGLDPESVRRCLRSEREGRTADSGGSDPAATGNRSDGSAPSGAPELSSCVGLPGEAAQPSPPSRRRRRRVRTSEGSMHPSRRASRIAAARRRRPAESPASEGGGALGLASEGGGASLASDVPRIHPQLRRRVTGHGTGEDR
ncbi:DUF4192 domain-containing protein [Streptomyces sp. NPDC005481]|uniref:DUF4192 domain-containing protein n=1 Tax=Streptomyces sp. NPDC005481 TaxID=3154881 RepID=UPI0033AFA4BA